MSSHHLRNRRRWRCRVRRKGLAWECWWRLLSVGARRAILPAILAHSRTSLYSIIARTNFLTAFRPRLRSRPWRRVPTAKWQKLVVIMFVDDAVQRTMPNRLSTEAVSMVCSAGTSTRNNECSGRNGILACIRGVCASSASNDGGVVDNNMNNVVGIRLRSGLRRIGVSSGGRRRASSLYLRLRRSAVSVGHGARVKGKRIDGASAETSNSVAVGEREQVTVM